MTWCGFIDLLGTKESANASESRLQLGLSNLHSTLHANFGRLHGGVCYAFSDGAFFQTASIESFVSFYVEVRKELFSNGHFFKCAIVRDALTADLSFSESGGAKSLNESRFVSIRFGGGAPRAYIDQDRFKGVGSILSRADHITDKERRFLVNSFYISDNLRNVRDYIDVKFTPDETGSFDEANSETQTTDWETRSVDESADIDKYSFLEIFLHEVSKIKSRSKRYARYYLPTLVSMMRSLDFTALDFDGDEWISSPYLFDQIFISKRFDKIFGDSPGFELLYWATVDEIYRQRAGLSEKAKNALMHSLLPRRGMFKEMDAIPSHVVDPSVKEDMIARKARFEALIAGRR